MQIINNMKQNNEIKPENREPPNLEDGSIDRERNIEEEFKKKLLDLFFSLDIAFRNSYCGIYSENNRFVYIFILNKLQQEVKREQDDAKKGDVMNLFKDMRGILVEELNQNAKIRFIKNMLILPLYCIAYYLNTRTTQQGENEVSPNILLTILCCLTALSESTEKRNVAAIGNFNECQAEEKVKGLEMVVKNLAKKNPGKYNEDVIAGLSKKGFLPMATGFIKFLSYFSGAALIFCEVVYEILHKDEIVKNSKVQDQGNNEVDQDIFGLMSIAMPLVNTGIWYLAAHLSQRRVGDLEDRYEEVCMMVAKLESKNTVNTSEMERLPTEIEQDIYNKIYKKDVISRDNRSLFESDDCWNPLKILGFLSYVLSGIRQRVPLPECVPLQNQDITRTLPLQNKDTAGASPAVQMSSRAAAPLEMSVKPIARRI